jgi:fumarate hydratase, class I
MKTVKLATAKELDGCPPRGTSTARPSATSSWRSGCCCRAAARHRRPVRRQVLRPRRPRHPPAAPRRLLPGRHGGLLLRRPQHQGEDHRDGLFVEELDRNPGRLIPEQYRGKHEHGVKHRPEPPMPRSCRAEQAPGRHAAAAHRHHRRRPRHRPRQVQGDPRRGKPLPEYLKNHPIYYAGPAKTPPGKPSGSFGPTTAGRMDSYVDLLQSQRRLA